MTFNSTGACVAVALLTWAIVALGGSWPWASAPLIGGMTAHGALALIRYRDSSAIPVGLIISLAALCIAIALQLVPLPGTILTIITPALHATVEPGASWHPISTNPAATALGLTFVVSLSLFFLGLAVTIHRDGVKALAVGLVALGVLVAIAGILETSTHWPGVYALSGLALPPDSTPLGPFSSKNHFAAWILMTMSITVALLCARIEQAPHFWNVRVVGFQCAAATMAVALVQTRSRAGTLGVIAMLAMMGSLLMQRATGGSKRAAIAAGLTALLVAGIAATGGSALVRRFAAPTWSTAHGRLPIWRQAADIARDFPITGAGLNSYQTVVRFYPSVDLDAPYEGAHNDYLQLALEGGLLVGLPMLSVIGYFIHEIRRRFLEASDDSTTHWLRIGAVVGLTLVALQETVDFSLQVPANAALFVALGAIAIHRAPRATTAATSWNGENPLTRMYSHAG